MVAPEATATPQDLTAERSVIAAMLSGPSAAELAGSLLAQDDFYRQAHGLIFAAILRLNCALSNADLTTVVGDLRSTGNLDAAGGPAAVADVLAHPGVPANLHHYARAVRDAASRRAAVRAAMALARDAADPTADLTTTLAGHLAQTAEISVGPARGPEALRDGLADVFLGEKPPAVPLGLDSMSPLKVTPGRLCTWAARPGKGKTAMLGTIALASARAGWNVLLFSLEMTGLEIRQRLLAGFAEIPLEHVEDQSDPRLSDAASRLAELPIWIQDESRGRLDVETISATVRRFTPRPTLVLVDYLQLVGTRARFERRYEAIGHVCRELKHTALRAGVPVIVAAQLSRAAEERQGKPQLSDLRESGEIEQTSNQVVLIHRDESGATALKVAKNRHGPTFTRDVYFRGEICLFQDNEGGWS